MGRKRKKVGGYVRKERVEKIGRDETVKRGRKKRKDVQMSNQ